VEFLLSVIELLFLSHTVEALQGKMCQNSLSSGQGRSFGAKISGRRVVHGKKFFVSTKLETFGYLTVQTAPCYTCRRFDTIPACDGRTEGQTDGRTDGQNCRS